MGSARRWRGASVFALFVVLASALSQRGAASSDGRRSADALLGEYSTRFVTYGRYDDRAYNVRLAAAALDGHRIPARGTFSFNETVGDRSLERGYRHAPVIAMGEVRQGVGGGVCQTATTLFAAAFFAGLEIVRQEPHSRPSDYAPPGLDATVVYPDVDLVLSNPFAFPLRIESQTGEHHVTIRIRGTRRPRRVFLGRIERRGRPFDTWRRIDPSLSSGQREVEQEGADGTIVVRVRLIEEAGRTTREEREIEYPPTPRIVRVPPPPS